MISHEYREGFYGHIFLPIQHFPDAFLQDGTTGDAL